MSEALLQDRERERERERPPSSSLCTAGLSMAEVRRCLAAMRRKWDGAHCDPHGRPAYLSDELGGSPPISMAAFSLLFVLAHHAKRGEPPAAQA